MLLRKIGNYLDYQKVVIKNKTTRAGKTIKNKL